MAILYADISPTNDVNIGYDGLLESTPLTWDNLLTRMLTVNSPDEYRLRGVRQVSGNVDLIALNIGAFLTGWNLNVYGPWRIQANTLAIHCTASDGIISVTDAGTPLAAPLLIGGFPNNSITYSNIHFSAPTGWVYIEHDKSQIFRGCNLSVNGEIKISYGTSYDVTKTILDSIFEGTVVIDNTTGVYSDTLFIRNAVFGMSEAAFDIAVTDPDLTVDIIKEFCQFGLPAIVWPAWDGIEEVWRAEALAENIRVSGSGNYAGYSTGLFGYPRTGVGAFSFNFIEEVQFNDFVFASKIDGLVNSELIVINNIVSHMRVQENADVDVGNIQADGNILVRSQGSIEEADYNLNNTEGQRAIGITPSIADTAAYDPELPRLLEEDFYRKKRSQLVENGDDSADAGAIEVNYLDDTKTYQDVADSNLALITPQARNIMARSVLGQAACKITGFAIGRGGYVYHNPVKVLPIDTYSDVARGYIILVNNTWSGTEVIEIQGRLPYKSSFMPAIIGDEVDDVTNHIYYFKIGDTLEDTLDNIAAKINEIRDLWDTIYTERENDTLHLIAVPLGTIGNTIWYSAIGSPFETPHANPLLGGSLTGGVDEVINNLLIDSIYEGTVDNEQCILEYANRSALAVTVKIHPNLGIQSAVGEFILKAKITQSNFPGEVGTEFAFAVGHHPICVIHNKAIWVKRYVIQM